MTDNSNIIVLKREGSNCQSCMRRGQCPAYEQGVDAAAGISHKTTRQGQFIFKAGEDFDGIYMVRSGFFKSYFIDADGEMQVTGFHFPGEVFGIDGIETGRYSHSVEALDTGSLCKLPIALFSGESSARRDTVSSGHAAHRQPGAERGRLMLSLVRIMSKAIARDRDLIFALGKMNARRRFAAFLVDVAERMEQSGFDPGNLRLCMSRIDIANYLGLAVETVSRLFTLFQANGLLRVNRRELQIVDMGFVRALAEGACDSELLDKAG